MYGHREACGFDIGLCQCANLHHCSLCDGKIGRGDRIGVAPQYGDNVCGECYDLLPKYSDEKNSLAKTQDIVSNSK